MFSWASKPHFKQALAAIMLAQVVACTSPEDQAQKHLTSGQELLAKGEATQAAAAFNDALKFKRDLLPAWRGLADAEEKRQNWGAVLAALRAVVQYEPANDAARLKLSRLLLAARAFDEALLQLAPLSDVEAPSAEALSLKAAILFNLRDEEGAVREAERAIKVEPDNLQAAMVLASHKMGQRDFRAALALLDRGKVEADSQFVVGLMRTQIFAQLGDDRQLEAELRKLLNQNPGESLALRRQLVSFYVARGRDRDAEQELRAAAAAEPANLDPFMDLVRFLNTKKGADAAQAEILARIKAGGDVYPYRLALADLEVAQGKPEQAIAGLEPVIAAEADPGRRAAAQVKVASIRLGQKNFTAAEAIADDVLKADNRHTDALRVRATARLERGQVEPAITDLRQALNDQPRSVPLLQLMAMAFERSGQIELAERHHADAARASEFDPAVALDYVAFLQRRGSQSRVEDVLTEAASRHPTSVPVWTALAQARLQRGDWVGAQEAADAIKRLGDQGGLADQIRGLALSGQNKFNESIQVLQSAAQAAPEAIQPLATLMRTYVRARKFDEAEAFLGGILKANPNNAQAYILLAGVQLARNAPDQAIRSLKLAIERSPADAGGYVALADIYRQQGKLDLAFETAQAGLRAQPDHFGLRLTAAAVHEANQEFGKAITEYEALFAKQPNSLIVANNLASLLANHRTDEASLERAQQLAVMLRNSALPHFNDTLGWLAYLRGDYNTATRLLEQAAEALPNLPEVRYHLGMSYRKAGDEPKAQEQLRQADVLEKGQSWLKEKIRAAL